MAKSKVLSASADSLGRTTWLFLAGMLVIKSIIGGNTKTMTNFFTRCYNFMVNTFLWKKIYVHRENASDKCTDDANVLEGIVLKNA